MSMRAAGGRSSILASGPTEKYASKGSPEARVPVRNPDEPLRVPKSTGVPSTAKSVPRMRITERSRTPMLPGPPNGSGAPRSPPE